jgi:hypothetical protein
MLLAGEVEQQHSETGAGMNPHTTEFHGKWSKWSNMPKILLHFVPCKRGPFGNRKTTSFGEVEQGVH